MELDVEIELGGVTYQIEGTVTDTLIYEQRCERGLKMGSETETCIEIDKVTYGDDFEHTLIDKEVLKDLEAELYKSF